MASCTTRRSFLVGFLVFSLFHSPVFALFADEAGISDFLVATAGHGPTKFVHSSSTLLAAGSVITSDSAIVGHQLVASEGLATTSCFVASRNIETGALIWRRNVCTTSHHGDNGQTTSHHAVGAAQDTLWTMDSSGVIRAWGAAERGQLLWDAFLRPTLQPRILVPAITGVDDEQQPTAIGGVADEWMVLVDATTGEALGEPLDAQQVLKDNGGSSSRAGQPRWLQIVSDEKDKWRVLLGWVHNRDGIVTTTGSDLLLVTMEWQEEYLRITESQRLNHIKQLDVSSLYISPSSGSGFALSADRKQAMIFGLSNGQNNCDSADVSSMLSWSRLTSLAPMGDTVVRVSGVDTNGNEKQALLQLPSWTPIQVQSQPLTASSVAFSSCGGSESLLVAMQMEDSALQLWTSTDGGATLQKVQVEETPGDIPSNMLPLPTMTVLRCEHSSLEVLFSSSAGTTSSLQLTFSSSSSVSSAWKWTAEEGLGHITSALLLDASHAVVVDDLVGDDSEQEPAEIASRLQFSARLASQWQSLVGIGTSMFSSSSSTKDRLFGFLKVAVLVSELTHRLYGMELAGQKRGSVLWSVDLPTWSSWHKMVHGTFNAPKATHGIQGGTHGREILVVSGNSNVVNWKCVDGTHGDIHAEGNLEIASPVVQVLPMVGGGLCRQQAVLMHADHSISVIPDNDSSAQSTLKHTLEASANGLFAHSLAEAHGVARLESYQVLSQTAPARLVGQTSFAGERLVHTVYPTRDEVVQSPCTVLGDDSLLLKYLNPHLAVLITIRDDSTGVEEDSFYSVLRKSLVQTDKKKKKKPLGATPKSKADPSTAETDTAAVKEEEPNFFVNVVDTVSGRVLYRASHTNAATSPRHIRAVISENWIVYSFVNAKTRKAEVGVLSLYEGMIHRKGLTAFTSPEQTTDFSSWDARETKPVVLAKTYSIPKPVTALGVTQTRNGISSHQILLATTDDRIFAVERKVLEPRRPLSDLKESEKLEGLRQYSELIPLVSLQALSYNLTVHSPSHILSSPTELESQTLVFAFGGPDIFFARTSPSKGFDMLPESFNRVLLSMLVVALVSVVVVTKRMATQKMVKHGWI